MSETETLYTQSAAARYKRVNPSTIFRARKRGALKFRLIGGVAFVSKHALDHLPVLKQGRPPGKKKKG